MSKELCTVLEWLGLRCNGLWLAWDALRLWQTVKLNQRQNMRTLDEQINQMVPQWRNLFVQLKGQIYDDYRASDDPDDNTPGMQVTIGFTPDSGANYASWSYQTGDNSYTGGAYGHPHWAVVSLYRRSNSRTLAEEAADQIGELVCQ